MSRRSLPALPILFWALLLALLTAVAVLAFDVDATSPALLGGAAAAVFATGLVLAAIPPGPPPEIAAEPDTSAATVWLAAAVALLALSAAAGLWLTLIAAGLVGIGVGAVIRELAAQRRALRGGDRDHR